MKKSIYLEYLEYLPILFVEKIVFYLPDTIVFKIATLFGYLLYLFGVSLRKEAYKGLFLAFGKTKTNNEIRAINKNSFIHIGKLFFEVIQFTKWTPEKLEQKIHFSKGSLETIKSLSQKGKGIVLVSAHFGNWELLVLVIGYLGYSLNIVFRPLDNRLLNQYVNKRRIMYNSRLVSREEAFNKGCYALKQNELVILLTDQNQAKGGIFVPFFGKPASTAKGAAVLTKRTNASMMAAYVERNLDHTHTITFKELKTQKMNSSKEFIYSTTKQISAFFEKVIEHRPEQWLWIHPRWKTRPILEK